MKMRIGHYQLRLDDQDILDAEDALLAEEAERLDAEYGDQEEEQEEECELCGYELDSDGHRECCLD